MEFSGILVFVLGISKGDVIQFCTVSRGGALIFLEFPGVKFQGNLNEKFQGSFQKSMSQPPGDFFWNRSLYLKFGRYFL